MFLCSGAPAVAATLDVGPGETYATLAEALAAAVDGDKIVVRADEIAEEVTISNLAVRIVSYRSTRWLGPTFGDTSFASVTVDADADVVIGGFRFEGQQAGLVGAVDGGTLTAIGIDAGGPGFTSGFHVDSGTLVIADSTLHDFHDRPVIDASGGEVRLVRTALSTGGILGPAVAIAAAATLDSRATSYEGFRRRDAGPGGAVECSGHCGFRGDRFEANQAAFAAALAGNDVVVERSRFCGNTGGSILRIQGAVRSSLFLDNTDNLGDGLVYAAGSLDLEHDAFVGNTSAGLGMVFSDGGTVRSTGSVYAHNDALGPALGVFRGGTIASTYDAFFDNSGGDASFALDPTDLVGSAPLLVPGAGCTSRRARLIPGSPLIDAGDPAEADRDGTRADIGAFGGPRR